MGATYDENEANAIYQAFSNCDVWSIGVVRVYKAVGGKWNWTGITGAAVMASEKGPSEEDLCYIRVFDLKSNTTVLEQELWYFFNYEEATPWFHTFESNAFVFGLSFADEGEASDFYNKVIESVEIQKLQAPPEADPNNAEAAYTPAPTPVAPTPAARGPPPPGPSGPPPPSPAASHPPPLTTQGSGNLGQAQVIEGLPMKAIPIRNALIGKDSPQPKQPPQKKKSGGLFGWGGKKKEEPVHIPVVGAPTDFKHESHIGWDPERGFEIRNIPPEWKALFQAAGVKKSELTDAATAKMIMETVVEVVSGVAPPPPPPPPGPPPPPVPGAPRPPPAPGAPPAGGGGGGGGGGGRGDLLSQIQAGKNLKKVDETAVAAGVPDLKNLDAGATNNLAQILSDRLKAMRPSLEDVDSDEEQADEDWS